MIKNDLFLLVMGRSLFISESISIQRVALQVTLRPFRKMAWENSHTKIEGYTQHLTLKTLKLNGI